jgi:hypothetical protein
VRSEAPPRTRAGILHSALTGGLLVITATNFLLRSGAAADIGANQTFVLQPVALAFGGSGFGAATVIRSRIQPVAPNGSESDWWQSDLPRALTVWALIEGRLWRAPCFTG